MPEPFRRSFDEEQHNDEIPNFSPSELEGCYETQYKGKTEPIPITDILNVIFDEGSVIHGQEEILNEGARRIIYHEKYYKIVHDSELFSISAKPDYEEFDMQGMYIRDIKSTKQGGLFYFIRDKISHDYVVQMSIYSYIVYVFTGIYQNEGVILKISKENPRFRVQRPVDLMDKIEVRGYLVEHPVINCIIGNITYNALIGLNTEHMKGQTWKCTNCQYQKDCDTIKLTNDLTTQPKVDPIITPDDIDLYKGKQEYDKIINAKLEEATTIKNENDISLADLGFDVNVNAQNKYPKYPGPQIADKSKLMYFCTKCNRKHFERSVDGKAHMEKYRMEINKNA